MDTATAINVAGGKVDAAQEDIDFYTYCIDVLAHSDGITARDRAWMAARLAEVTMTKSSCLAIKEALAELP